MIQCTDRELAYLGMLVGGDGLLGVPDPFPGWFAEEIRTALKASARTLAERGLITCGRDGCGVPNPQVESLIRTVAFFDRAVIATLSVLGGHTKQIVYYSKPPYLVELISERVADAPGGFSIRGISGGVEPPTLSRQIVSWWNVANPLMRVQEVVSLEQDVLRRARQMAGTGGAAAVRNFLENRQAPALALDALAETLAGATQNGAVAVIDRLPGRWKTTGMGMLASERGPWRLDPFEWEGRPMVACTPCDPAGLESALGELLAGVVPARSV